MTIDEARPQFGERLRIARAVAEERRGLLDRLFATEPEVHTREVHDLRR